MDGYGSHKFQICMKITIFGRFVSFPLSICPIPSLLIPSSLLFPPSRPLLHNLKSVIYAHPVGFYSDSAVVSAVRQTGCYGSFVALRVLTKIIRFPLSIYDISANFAHSVAVVSYYNVIMVALWNSAYHYYTTYVDAAYCY